MRTWQVVWKCDAFCVLNTIGFTVIWTQAVSGLIVLLEQWSNKPRKEWLKSWTYFIPGVCELKARPPCAEKPWIIFSVANTCIKYRYCWFFFFYNRQFILPSERICYLRDTEGLLLFYVGFFFNQFWVSEPFCFKMRGGFKQGLFIFSPLNQTSLSALCFLASASKASLCFCLFSCRLLLFGELVCTEGSITSPAIQQT